MENCSHGCNSCPPWWVTMGFVPPLQRNSAATNPPPIDGGIGPSIPPRPPYPIDYTPPSPPPFLVGPRGEAIPPPVPNVAPRIPNPVNPILDIFNPITGPLNPLGGIIKNLFGGIG